MVLRFGLEESHGWLLLMIICMDTIDLVFHKKIASHKTLDQFSPN